MSNRKHCDNGCGVSVPVGKSEGWWPVGPSTARVQTTLTRETDPSGDYCSLACLKATVDRCAAAEARQQAVATAASQVYRSFGTDDFAAAVDEWVAAASSTYEPEWIAEQVEQYRREHRRIAAVDEPAPA